MIYAILFFGIVLLDQLSKAYVEALFQSLNLTSKPIIEDVLLITIERNEGASFGMLGDQPWAQTFFLVITVIVLIGFYLYLVFTKNKSKFFICSAVMIMGGAVGNFIDRLAFKAVRDFIDVRFFICNVADIFICVGAFMLAFYFIFLDEDAIFKKKKKVAETDGKSEEIEETQSEVKDENNN